MSDVIKHLDFPNPEIFRLREAARGKAGEVKNVGCPHPVSAIEWIVDDERSTGRDGRPTNLFVCGVCNGFLRLVDFNGNEAPDG